MAYRDDKDLEFLKDCSNEQLDRLVEVLTKQSNGDPRLTEELTQSDRYKEHSPNHKKYWDLIAAEIQCFGANTFATMFRGGKGVKYREVLKDVCDKLDVDFDRDSPTYDIELALLKHEPSDSKHTNRTSDTDPIAVGLEAKSFASVPSEGGGGIPRRAASVGAAAAALLMGRAGMASAGAALGGAVVLAAVASPAYRVTKKAVPLVAGLRQFVVAKGFQNLESSFSKRFWEAANLLDMLGAHEISVESRMALSSRKADKLDVGLSDYTMEYERETLKNHSMRLKYKVKYKGRRDSQPLSFVSMLEKSVYGDDPFFMRLLNDYRRGALEASEHKFEYECSLESLAHGKLEVGVSEYFRIIGRVKREKKDGTKFSMFARF